MNIHSETLWNSLPVPGFVIDEKNIITGINPATELFLNLSASKICGRPVLEKLSVNTLLEAAIEKVRANHSAVFIKNVDVRVGGSAPVVSDIQIAPVTGQPGKVLILLEPQRMADGLGQSHAVKSSARSAIGMAEMLAHEIKNPLAGITGAAQLLAMNLTARDREMTDLIVAESHRVVALLEQVEQFGNLRPPSCEPANIHDILNQALTSARVGFAAGMTICEDFDPSLPLTFVDRDQIIQVFLNLFKNASEAADAGGGQLTIRTYYDAGLRLRRRDGSGNSLPLQIEIIDDGPGLPADIAEDVFEPFVSGRENGTGLGLALVSKIISDHEGWVSVDSAPGRTLFRVSLPVAENEQIVWGTN